MGTTRVVKHSLVSAGLGDRALLESVDESVVDELAIDESALE